MFEEETVNLVGEKKTENKMPFLIKILADSNDSTTRLPLYTSTSSPSIKLCH